MLCVDFQSDGYPLEIFRDILESCKLDMGTEGQISVQCRIEKKDEGYDKKWRDKVGAEIRRGRFSLEYAACSYERDKNVPKEYYRKVRQEALSQVIKAANLPIAETIDGKNYVLKPAIDGIKLQASHDLLLGGGQNASGFTCELPNATVADLIERIQAILTHFKAVGDKVESEWVFISHVHDNKELITQFNEIIENNFTAHQASTRKNLEKLIEKNFPSQKIDTQFYFYIKHLDEIENLHEIGKAVGGKKDEGFLTNLCVFPLPEGDLGKISISTTSKGHELSVGFTSPESVSVVEQKLGFKLKPESYKARSVAGEEVD